MSVLAALAREHRLFERLIARLRPADDVEPGEARVQLEEALALLLPALDRHDRLEDLVYGRPEASWPKDEELAHRLVEAQHASIHALRAEVSAVLETDCPLARLAALAGLLAEKLKWHLQTEEMLLWPLQARRHGRSIDGSLERQARRDVEELERAVSRALPT